MSTSKLALEKKYEQTARHVYELEKKYEQTARHDYEQEDLTIFLINFFSSS
jgi:hypothetical protein